MLLDVNLSTSNTQNIYVASRKCYGVSQMSLMFMAVILSFLTSETNYYGIWLYFVKL